MFGLFRAEETGRFVFCFDPFPAFVWADSVPSERFASNVKADVVTGFLFGFP